MENETIEAFVKKHAQFYNREIKHLYKGTITDRILAWYRATSCYALLNNKAQYFRHSVQCFFQNKQKNSKRNFLSYKRKSAKNHRSKRNKHRSNESSDSNEENDSSDSNNTSRFLQKKSKRNKKFKHRSSSSENDHVQRDRSRSKPKSQDFRNNKKQKRHNSQNNNNTNNGVPGAFNKNPKHGSNGPKVTINHYSDLRRSDEQITSGFHISNSEKAHFKYVTKKTNRFSMNKTEFLRLYKGYDDTKNALFWQIFQWLQNQPSLPAFQKNSHFIWQKDFVQQRRPKRQFAEQFVAYDSNVELQTWEIKEGRSAAPWGTVLTDKARIDLEEKSGTFSNYRRLFELLMTKTFLTRRLFWDAIRKHNLVNPPFVTAFSKINALQPGSHKTYHSSLVRLAKTLTMTLRKGANSTGRILPPGILTIETIQQAIAEEWIPTKDLIFSHATLLMLHMYNFRTVLVAISALTYERRLTDPLFVLIGRTQLTNALNKTFSHTNKLGCDVFTRKELIRYFVDMYDHWPLLLRKE